MAALTLAQGAALVGDQTFQYRVAMAFYFAARTVYAEGENTPGHENRKRFAESIVRQDYTQFLQYAAMVVTDPAIIAAGPANQAAVTDAQIVQAVSTMWNALANVS
jgi:hypothetical protein